jgi:hypothetical protein
MNGTESFDCIKLHVWSALYAPMVHKKLATQMDFSLLIGRRNLNNVLICTIWQLILSKFFSMLQKMIHFFLMDNT